MVDAIKIAVKIGLVALITAAVLVLFTQVTFPAFDTSILVQAVGKGKAILSFYVGDFMPLLALGFGLLTVRFIGIPAVRLALLVFRWTLKVNE